MIRCVTRERYEKELDYWCPQSDVIDDANKVTIVENRRLSSAKGAAAVQVEPQRIKLKLRRGMFHICIAMKFIVSKRNPGYM